MNRGRGKRINKKHRDDFALMFWVRFGFEKCWSRCECSMLPPPSLPHPTFPPPRPPPNDRSSRCLTLIDSSSLTSVTSPAAMRARLVLNSSSCCRVSALVSSYSSSSSSARSSSKSASCVSSRVTCSSAFALSFAFCDMWKSSYPRRLDAIEEGAAGRSCAERARLSAKTTGWITLDEGAFNLFLLARYRWGGEAFSSFWRWWSEDCGEHGAR